MRSPSLFARRLMSSAGAMALALAGGVLASAGLPAAAQAQEYSREFVAAFTPIQTITQSGGTDFSAARPLIAPMLATVESADERFQAGNILLIVGQNQRDVPMQRQGIEMMLASGKVPVEAQGQYNYYIGNFAMQARDFEASRAALRLAVAAGYMPAQAAQDPSLDPRSQILQSYFFEDNYAGLIQYGDELLAAANGAQVPEVWLTYGLQAAIDTENLEVALRYSKPLIEYYPTARNIGNAVRVAVQLSALEDGPIVADAQRLLFAANALTERRDFTSYLASIDSRLMANEALRVLERGVSTGGLPASDSYYIAEAEVANERAASERRDAPGMLADARAAATGLEAYEAGEIYLSLGDYAQAEELYALALEKGPRDRDRELTRLGIAQFYQGKLAEASASFGQVTGPRAPIAQLWQAFIASQD